MITPTLATQIRAVEQCIAAQRETLKLLKTLGCLGSALDPEALRAEKERLITELEAVVRTLRSCMRPAPPERAVS